MKLNYKHIILDQTVEYANVLCRKCIIFWKKNTAGLAASVTVSLRITGAGNRNYQSVDSYDPAAAKLRDNRPGRFISSHTKPGGPQGNCILVAEYSVDVATR